MRKSLLRHNDGAPVLKRFGENLNEGYSDSAFWTNSLGYWSEYDEL
jgi:hypothetical protein